MAALPVATTSPLGESLCARRRWAGWVVLLAVLWTALVPSFSQAVASALGAQRVEICTPEGVQWVLLDEDGSERESSAGFDLPCPYCVWHIPAWGVPPSPWLLGVARAASHGPLAAPVAPRAVPGWQAAQPRAPPVPLPLAVRSSY